MAKHPETLIEKLLHITDEEWYDSLTDYEYNFLEDRLRALERLEEFDTKDVVDDDVFPTEKQKEFMHRIWHTYTEVD